MNPSRVEVRLFEGCLGPARSKVSSKSQMADGSFDDDCPEGAAGMSSFRFAFGKPLLPVKVRSRGRRRVFVIGVYPSALHARWVAPDRKTISRAIAIDNEPEPFWKGEDAAERISQINVSIPRAAGNLIEPGSAFNGPSGIALDRSYLGPMGFMRRDCWITDLQNVYLANAGQIAVINGPYARMMHVGLPAASLPERKGTLASLPEERMQELRSEFEESESELVITLGNEPIKVLKLGASLRQEDYGTRRSVRLFDRQVDHLPLVHPRQSGGLGSHSASWRTVHARWISAQQDSP